MSECHVVVTGPPASGKTFVAVAIGKALPAVVLSKDLIKEALAEPLAIRTDEESLRLSGAAMALIYRLAAASGAGVVMEANWKAHVDGPKLERLTLPIIQVVCDAPTHVLRARMFDRIESGERHSVHRDVMSPRVLESMLASIDAQREPLPLSGPVLRVDTSVSQAIDDAVTWIRQQDC